MDPSAPLLPKMSLTEENDKLNRLYHECESFLQKWRAYSHGHSDRPTDAFVAIFELQVLIVARRGYILAMLTQEKLPF